MKILLMADLHLDSKLGSIYTKEQAKERKAEILNTFSRIVRFASENDVKAVLISGDLFDTNTVSKTVGRLVMSEIVAHPEIAFYYLKGNHDAKGFLELFEAIPENLHTFEETWKSYDLSERIIVTGVEISNQHPELYETLSLRPEKFNIVMMHGQETDTQGASDGSAIRIRMLRDKNIDVLALGHVHQRKEEQLDARGIYLYPGCPDGRGYDEDGMKGAYLLTIKEELNNEELQVEFVPFSSRIVYKLEIDTQGCASTGEVVQKAEETLRGSAASQDDIVELVLVGAYDAEAELSLTDIEAHFAANYYVFKVKDDTTRQIDYESYAADASLKGEFVRLVQQSADFTDEEKATIIRYGIEALAGEEFL